MSEAETAVGRNPQAAKADTVRSAPITPTEKEPQRKRQRISNEEHQGVNETADAAQEPTESRKMFECIKMITRDEYDISEFCTEQGCKTNFPDSDYYLKFPKKSIANVILKLNDIVIEKIRVEMRNAKKGAIIHENLDNRQKEPNVLYVGVAASYNDVDGKPVQSLLACGYPSKDKDQKDPVALSEFNACRSMKYIQRDVFSDRFGFNETDLDEWMVCTISEEYGAASRLVSKKFDCPKVPCHSGLLDSQIRDMLVRTKETRGGAGRLVSHAFQLTKMALECKHFNNISGLSVSETLEIGRNYWYDDAKLFWRFKNQKNAIMQAVQCSDGKKSKSFKELIQDDSSLEKLDQVLHNFDCLSDVLGYKAEGVLPLNLCRNYLKNFLDYVEANKENVQSEWFGHHELGDEFISPSSTKLDDLDFITGVCKIQNKEFMLLSPQEKYACSKLKNTDTTSTTNNNKINFEAMLKETKRNTLISSKDQHFVDNDNHGGYYDCSFITGAAYGVFDGAYSAHDRWIDKKDDFEGRYPLLEAVTMLGFNRRLWNESTVAEAINSGGIEW